MEMHLLEASRQSNHDTNAHQTYMHCLHFREKFLRKRCIRWLTAFFIEYVVKSVGFFPPVSHPSACCGKEIKIAKFNIMSFRNNFKVGNGVGATVVDNQRIMRCFSSLRIEKPLVAQLEGRKCTYEVAILKGVATVAFCDALCMREVHAKVLNEAVGVFVWDAFTLGREQLAKFKALKVIVKVGPGLTGVDLAAAGERKIAVCHVNGYGIEEAADSTMSLILDSFRMKTFPVTTSNRYATFQCVQLRGKTLGIIGLSLVARAVSIRAMALGMKVSFYDPFIGDGYEKVFGITRVDHISQLLGQADIVSLHCSLNDKSIGIINEASIQFMRPGAIIVNIKDEGLIEESALAAALHSGQIGGAALDTHNPDFNRGPLRDAPNLIRTPGTAYFSEVSVREFREAAAEEMKAFLEEGPRSLRLRYLKNSIYF
ncbi:C-terminal-binding protein [Orchesella cincta]|uniref:C-terminal-binding protein n=1 Tax=Orchesella cincta TaxID=48709 RepID=A0A1D2NDS0_ORCCI|nr:C-terminal-binding protein [Orchesella cincta]